MNKTNWKKCKLGDVATTTTTKISCSDITSNYISTENMLPDKGGIVAASSFPNSGNVSIYHKGDVLVSNIRPYFKKIWHATVDGAVSNDVIVFHANEGVNSRYLYYTLADDNFFAYVMTGAKGTKMPRGDRKQILQYPVNLPSLEEQTRIAEILGSLDDKIELLQKQNKTLEDMAKALFKSWFVDFDVVRAKAALATRRNLSPLRGKCHNVAKGGPNKPNSSCALVSTHQIYAKSVKNLVRAMRQNLTPQEVKLWQYLRKEQLGVKFRRQFPIDSKYIADFACLEKKLIIELDGTQHAENQHDKERTLYLEDNGFTVLRFWNNEIDKNLIGCLERIRELLNRPPLPAYEENGADNTPLPACGVLSPQGGQITSEADIMREYHLTDELYDLFPSSFADSPLGPIPSGWEVKNVGELLAFSIGGGWGNEEESESFPIKAPVIRGTDIPSLRSSGAYNDVPVRFHKKSNHTSRELKEGDIVLEVAGGSKGQPVGRALFVSDYIIKSLPKVICASFCKLLRPNKKLLLSELFYLYLDMMYQTGEIEQYQVQSTGISNFQFKQFCEDKQFVIPNTELQKKLSLNVYIDKIGNNKKQIQTLTELRDTLLPPLISGKIRV